MIFLRIEMINGGDTTTNGSVPLDFNPDTEQPEKEVKTTTSLQPVVHGLTDLDWSSLEEKFPFNDYAFAHDIKSLFAMLMTNETQRYDVDYTYNLLRSVGNSVYSTAFTYYNVVSDQQAVLGSIWTTVAERGSGGPVLRPSALLTQQMALAQTDVEVNPVISQMRTVNYLFSGLANSSLAAAAEHLNIFSQVNGTSGASYLTKGLLSMQAASLLDVCDSGPTNNFAEMVLSAPARTGPACAGISPPVTLSARVASLKTFTEILDSNVTADNGWDPSYWGMDGESGVAIVPIRTSWHLDGLTNSVWTEYFLRYPWVPIPTWASPIFDSKGAPWSLTNKATQKAASTYIDGPTGKVLFVLVDVETSEESSKPFLNVNSSTGAVKTIFGEFNSVRSSGVSVDIHPVMLTLYDDPVFGLLKEQREMAIKRWFKVFGSLSDYKSALLATADNSYVIGPRLTTDDDGGGVNGGYTAFNNDGTSELLPAYSQLRSATVTSEKERMKLHQTPSGYPVFLSTAQDAIVPNIPPPPGATISTSSVVSLILCAKGRASPEDKVELSTLPSGGGMFAILGNIYDIAQWLIYSKDMQNFQSGMPIVYSLPAQVPGQVMQYRSMMNEAFNGYLSSAIGRSAYRHNDTYVGTWTTDNIIDYYSVTSDPRNSWFSNVRSPASFLSTAYGVKGTGVRTADVTDLTKKVSWTPFRTSGGNGAWRMNEGPELLQTEEAVRFWMIASLDMMANRIIRDTLPSVGYTTEAFGNQYFYQGIPMTLGPHYSHMLFQFGVHYATAYPNPIPGYWTDTSFPVYQGGLSAPPFFQNGSGEDVVKPAIKTRSLRNGTFINSKWEFENFSSFVENVVIYNSELTKAMSRTNRFFRGYSKE